MDWFIQEVTGLSALDVIESTGFLINNRRDKEGYSDLKEDNDDVLKFNEDVTASV